MMLPIDSIRGLPASIERYRHSLARPAISDRYELAQLLDNAHDAAIIVWLFRYSKISCALPSWALKATLRHSNALILTKYYNIAHYWL